MQSAAWLAQLPWAAALTNFRDRGLVRGLAIAIDVAAKDGDLAEGVQAGAYGLGAVWCMHVSGLRLTPNFAPGCLKQGWPSQTLHLAHLVLSKRQGNRLDKRRLRRAVAGGARQRNALNENGGARSVVDLQVALMAGVRRW